MQIRRVLTLQRSIGVSMRSSDDVITGAAAPGQTQARGTEALGPSLGSSGQVDTRQRGRYSGMGDGDTGRGGGGGGGGVTGTPALLAPAHVIRGAAGVIRQRARGGSGRGRGRGRGSVTRFLSLLLSAFTLLLRPAAAVTNPRDVAALLAFKAALDTPANLDWPDVKKGGEGADPCAEPMWKGVQCVQSAGGEYQVVNALQIMETPLGGTLAPELANLTAVRSIFLGSTGLGGSIPLSLSRMQAIELLGLDRNNFTNVAPATFSTLTRLSRLYLLANPLQDAQRIPDLGTLTNLDTLDLTSCGFGGPFPSTLGTLTALTYLGLAGNKLTGPLPEALFSSGLPNIVRITLSNNLLNGTIPAGISALSTLQDLSLQWNLLSGTIPRGLSELSSLTSLALSSNNLVGPVPEELGTLLPPALNLASLDVSSNDLTGPLPAFMKGVPPAKWAGNAFCSSTPGAPCPKEVTALLDFLAAVNYPPVLTESWKGPTPCMAGTRPWKGVLCSGGRVAGIVLPKVGLTGRIPESLGQLPGLVTLQLQNNSLAGPFPASLLRLPKLARVNVAHNALTGRPPTFGATTQADVTCNKFVPPVPCGTPAVRHSPPPRTKRPLAPRPKAGGNASEGAGRTRPPPAPQPTATASRPAPGPAGGGSGVDSEGRNAPSPAPGKGGAGAFVPGRLAESPPAGRSAVAVGAVVGGVVAAVLVVLLALCVFLVLWRRRRGNKVANEHHRLDKTKSWTSRTSASAITSASTMKGGGGSMADRPGTFRNSLAEGRTGGIPEEGSCFPSIQDLRIATQDFADSQIVGKGGFATVYKASMEGGREVAVKRMEVTMTGKGLQEFQAEINVLTGVRHRHLVSLLGYVSEEGERLLIYEYMSMGPLSHHLFQPAKRGLRPLSWEKRLTVALDVAKGVEYLHHLAHQSFIHRDLKPSNILLDTAFRAKVADFGLVKPTDIVDNFASVETRLAGTFGYLAPEYAATGRVTVMSDVYSYGVILMELITGRRALDESQPENRVQLVAWLTPHLGDPERLFRAIDPALAEEIQSTEGHAFRTIMDVATLGLHCVARDPRRRPNMSTVVASLTPLVAKWNPQMGAEADDSGEGGASLAEEVEKWQEEETSQLSFFGDPYFSHEGSFVPYPQSVHSNGTRGTDGFSTMAEPYSMIEQRPISQHGFQGDPRVAQSFAGYVHSHTSQDEVPTSMREAPVEPR